MKKIAENLYQSQFDFPFGKEGKGPYCLSAAYLLTQDSGNILFYSSRHIEESFDFISQKGKLSLQLLNHRDEASPYSDKVMEKFGAPLTCHMLEEPAVRKKSQAGKTILGGEVFGNVKAIHTPGHAPGSVCFFSRQKAGANILFTGDTFYPCALPAGLQWRVSIFDHRQEESRQSLKKLRQFEKAKERDLSLSHLMIQSLQKLRGLEAPLTAVPSLFIGNVSYETFEKAEWQAAIDACVQRLKQGEKH